MKRVRLELSNNGLLSPALSSKGGEGEEFRMSVVN